MCYNGHNRYKRKDEVYENETIGDDSTLYGADSCGDLCDQNSDRYYRRICQLR